MDGTRAATDPARRLRVGVVGCGAVAERYHLPALLASDDVEVVAMVDPVLERAQALAGRAGVPEAYADHGDLAGRVDLAVVAVPNAFHVTVATDLMRAGVDVLVEKPMARTVAECDEMTPSPASAVACSRSGTTSATTRSPGSPTTCSTVERSGGCWGWTCSRAQGRGGRRSPPPS